MQSASSRIWTLLPCPFPMTITITSWTLHIAMATLYFVIHSNFVLCNTISLIYYSCWSLFLRLSIFIAMIEIIIFIVIFMKTCQQYEFSWISHIIWFYQLLLLISPLDGIQIQHRAGEYNSLLVGQHWFVHVYIGECHLWVCPFFPNRIQYALLIFLGWFV